MDSATEALERLGVEIFEDIPWLAPGLLVALAIASLLAAPVARLLGTRRVIGWLVLASLGAIGAATLTPLGDGPSTDGCDLSRFGLAPVSELRTINDTSLNVVLFMPLGVAVAFLPGGRRRAAALILAATIPGAVEVIQLTAPTLGRGCQSADVVDNLTGLSIGFTGSVVGLWLRKRGDAIAPSGRYGRRARQ